MDREFNLTPCSSTRFFNLGLVSTIFQVVTAFVSFLGEYLFGRDLSKKLSLKEIEQFYDDIHQDILTMEFSIYKPIEGKLSEYNFAKFIINGCDFKQDRVEEYLKRIEKKFGKKPVKGISFKQVEQLMTAVKDIDNIDVALNMYFMGGLSIPQDEFR